VTSGAFAERTALSWQRTGLAVLVTSVIGAKAAQAVGSWLGVALTAGTTVTALAVVLRAQVRPPGGADGVTTRWHLMIAVTASVVALATAGCALALG
jgi:hypothetical protein